MTELEIKSLIESTIKSTMQEALKNCLVSCPIPQDLRDSLPHMAETFKTIGEGNLDHGLERVKENYKYVKFLRNTQDKIGGIVLKIIITAFTGSILAALAFGFFGKELPFKH